MMHRRQFLSAITGALLSGTALPVLAKRILAKRVPPPAPVPAVPVAESTSYQSIQATINVDYYRTAGDDQYPLVLILHGSGGLKEPALYTELAQALCAQGISAAIIHYFDQTGTDVSDPRTKREEFGTWFMGLETGIDELSRHLGVDANHIGIFGFSLGGSLALALASVDQRLKCLVDMGGTMPEKYIETTRRMPPTLLLRGAEDEVVGADRIRATENLLQRTSTKYDTVVFANQGHLFNGQARTEAINRAVEFYKRNLLQA